MLFAVEGERLEKKQALKKLCIWIAAELFLIALFVWVLDPFYQYHGPWFGLQQVLFDRENQVIGSIRNLSYDSVLLGSSEAENFDSTFLDEMYDCHALKVIRASGSTADLLYYLGKAHESQQLKRVFWCMDLFSLTTSTEVTVCSEYSPGYLFTETMLDDFTYLYNKDILMKKIPLMLAYSVTGINTGGHAYDWSDGKDFSVKKAMEAYDKPDYVAESQPPEEYTAFVEQNIALVKEEISSHPEIEYIVFFPPYSLLWWDNTYVKGEGEKYFYVLEQILPTLLSFPNVSVYYFQADREIVCNLDNYMDQVHYSPVISQYMLDCIAAGEYRVTEENRDTVVEEMRDTYQYIIEDAIYRYYDNSSVMQE